MDVNPRTPVLVGVGQCVQREAPTKDGIVSAPAFAARAARLALCDASPSWQALAARIDTLAVVRLFEHSTRKIAMVSHPYGTSNNVPRSVAERLGISPRRMVYSAVGGQSPQRLVNRYCEAIYRGESEAVLLTGAEVIANIKYALRQGWELDWHEEFDDDYDDQWSDEAMVTDYEMTHGLYLPLRAYPVCEHALRRRLRRNVFAHREQMAALLAPFTKIAAENPWAQFPTIRDARELGTLSTSNYLISEPYTRWMVAQDAVNQGAALVLTSVARARELGIPPTKWAYLGAYADVDDVSVIHRPDLSVSYAQRLAAGQCLERAGITSTEIDYLDIYSCFPVAIWSACEALGISANGRSLTLTGGLPFFGGPGNNYSMHAICEAVARVRRTPSSRALILANGGYLSKHSVGLYRGQLDTAWTPVESTAAQCSAQQQDRINIMHPPPAQAVIESYVLSYRRGAPDFAYVVCHGDASRDRLMAQTQPDDKKTLAALADTEPLGRRVAIEVGASCNHFQFIE